MQLLRRIPRRSSAGNNDEETPRQRTLPNSATVPRTYSEETLLNSNDQVNRSARTPQQNYPRFLVRSHSVLSSSSDSTAVDLVMGHSFSEFNSIRQLPIVSLLFQKGLYVFPSESSLEMFKETYKSKNNHVELLNCRRKGFGLPLLHCTAPIFSSFKKNSPLLVIYKFQPPTSTDLKNQNSVVDQLNFHNNKIEYCKAYFKLFSNGCSQYTLKFQPNGNSDSRGASENFEVKLMVSPRSPVVDAIYRNTRIRWIGTTLPSSTQGSGFFKLMVLNDESPGLLDHELRSSNSTSFSHTNVSSSEANHQPSAALLQSIHSDVLASLSSFPPIARFSDTNPKKTKEQSKMQKVPQKIVFRSSGDVKLLEVKPLRVEDAAWRNNETNVDINNDDTTNENNDDDADEGTFSERNSILNVPEVTLVMTCMSLVLRDQEVKKTSGNSRGFDGSAAYAFY